MVPFQYSGFDYEDSLCPNVHILYILKVACPITSIFLKIAKHSFLKIGGAPWHGPEFCLVEERIKSCSLSIYPKFKASFNKILSLPIVSKYVILYGQENERKQEFAVTIFGFRVCNGGSRVFQAIC